MSPSPCRRPPWASDAPEMLCPPSPYSCSFPPMLPGRWVPLWPGTFQIPFMVVSQSPPQCPPPSPGAPTVSVMPPGPVTVKEGKSLSLECLGWGEPRPLVRWSRLGSRQKVEHQTLLHMDSQAILQVRGHHGAPWGTEECLVLIPTPSPPALTGEARARRDLRVHSTQCPGLSAGTGGCQRGVITAAPWGPSGHCTIYCHRGGWGHRHTALHGQRYGEDGGGEGRS